MLGQRLARPRRKTAPEKDSPSLAPGLAVDSWWPGLRCSTSDIIISEKFYKRSGKVL
jgi:hypothetical protein